MALTRHNSSLGLLPINRQKSEILLRPILVLLKTNRSISPYTPPIVRGIKYNYGLMIIVPILLPKYRRLK